MSNFKLLEKQIDNEIFLCIKKVEELLKRAKKEGDIEIKSVIEVKEIQITRDCLIFMDEHQLVPNSKQHKHNFEQFIQTTNELLYGAKTYQKLSDDDKMLHELTENMMI